MRGRSLAAVALVTATNIIGCSGIRTDSSAITPPAGAMRVCDDAVIRAPGVVSARPNFVEWTWKDPDDFRPRYVQFYDSEPIAISTDGVDWRAEYSGTFSAGDAMPPDEARGGTQFAQARRNLYLTTNAGVVKMTTHDAPSLETSGMYAPGQAVISIASTGSWLPDGSLVAYRAVFRKIDVNTLETRSPPTPWTFVANSTGADRGVDISIPLPLYAAAGDVIELYRSLAVPAGTPSDTMFLSQRYTITSGDVIAGFVAITDELDASQLGEVLYTSSTREGIGGANNPPPRAFALAEWQGSVWAGAARYPHALVVDLVTAWTTPTTLTVSTTFGNYSAGTSSTAGLRPGMVIGEPAFPDGTKIVLITSGTSFTTDQPANTTSGSVAAGQPGDTVTIDGTDYIAASATNLATRRFKVWNLPGNPGGSAFATARELAYVVSFTSFVGDDIVAQSVEDVSVNVERRTGRMLFQRTDALAGAFTFSTTAPAGSFEAATSFTSTQETKPGRVVWSKPQEPEAFRALDYVDLGRDDPDSQVMAFAPLSDALLVFKLDGVWSIYGTFPNFGVERIDDAIIMGGDAVTVIDDVAYARTNRGIVALTGAGVAANLSEGVISGDLVAYNDISVQWARAWPTQGLVLFGVGLEVVYVWNILTRSWCRWTIPALQFTYDPETGTGYAPWDVDRWEVRESVAARGYDETHEIASGDWTAETADDVLSIGASSLGTWTPAAGDIVRAFGLVGEGFIIANRRVTEVADQGASWLLTIDSAMPAGAEAVTLTGYEVAMGVLEWQRNGVTPPSVGGFVRELQIHLDQTDAVNDALGMERLRLTVGTTSDQGTTRHDLVATPVREATYSRPVRVGVSRQTGRSTHLYGRVAIAELYAWKCLGIAFVGSAVSDKVRR